jgi:hypothetical protein
MATITFGSLGSLVQIPTCVGLNLASLVYFGVAGGFALDLIVCKKHF